MTARGLAVLALGFGFSARAEADLLDYVKRPEPAARWEKQSDRVSDAARIIELELISQVWQGAPWRHRLRVTLPARPTDGDLAVLVVTGGSRSWIDDEKKFVAETGVPLAVLGDVPNQPLFRRHEDGLVAYTFEQYLKTGSDEWPLLFPMTKAAVRAMDAVAEVAKQETGKAIGRFVVSGASKRGWTSWLAAVADPRVAGIAPMVFDNLNFARQMKNQLAVWGEYSPELGDYSERGLQALIDTERGQKLVSMVDPAAYRDSLARIPKLVVSGSNDPYWELDAVNLYWNDLGGPKSLLVVANAGHDAPSDPRTGKTLSAFVRRIVEQRRMPALRLETVELPRVSIASDEAAAGMRVWRAESATRDFRAARWTSIAARREGERFLADVESPASGFTALFAEADYREPEHSFTLATPIRLIEGRGR